MESMQAPAYRAAPWWKRVWSVVASSTLALMLGGVVATVIGAGAAYIVVTLTRLLRQ
jgi:hypothetical protein